jgi:hypothetical protein
LCSGHSKDNFAEHYYEGYNIYLHDKGQFWPNNAMDKLGQTKALMIPPNTEQEIDK